MFLESPKTLHWTFHARDKMRFYRLSEARVKRVMNSPKRVEEGVAPNTLAMMQPPSVRTSGGKTIWTQEIWVMTQSSSGRKGQRSSTKVISAWRYPGVSKPRSEVIKDMMKKEYRDFVSQERL